MTKRFAGRHVASDREHGTASDRDTGPTEDGDVGRCPGIGNEDGRDANRAHRWQQSEQR